MSFNNRRNKNRSLNNNNSNNANNYISSKNDKQNRIKSSVDKESTTKGVYRNKNFMLAKTSLVGTLANVVHKDGCIYEGVFSTFSPDLEIVLHTVSKVIPKAESNNVSPIIGSLLASLTAKNEFLDTVIFKLQDIVMMSIPNVNLDFAVRRNFTDTEISKFNPSSLTKEKDLVPWDGFNEETSGDEITLNDAEGWDADSMFKLNEKKYNIASTYSDSLEGYTVPLIKTDTEEYKKKELEANRIAQLIENDAASKDRLAKEDGDEEDKFSAVHRPVVTSSSLNTNSQNSSRSDNSNNMNNLNRRKNQNNLNTFNNNLRTKNSVSNNNFPTQSYSHFNSMPSQHDNRSNSGQIMHNRLNSRNESNKHHSSSNQSMNSSFNKQVDQHHEEKELHKPYLLNDHHNNTNLSNMNQSPLPQRTHTINRRSSTQKVRDETTHDLKKFSSAFKLAVQSQGSNINTNNSGNGKENINKDNNKDIPPKTNISNRQQINIKESEMIKNDSSSSKTESSPSSKKNIKDEEKQFNKPLIDKTPKETASGDKDQSEKTNVDKSKSSNENQTRPYTDNKNESENSSLNSSSIEITTNKNEENKLDSSTNQNDSSKNNVSSSSTNLNNENNIPSNSSDLSISLNEAEKTLKKSSLNPNAKEFVFNPTAKPYTPKFINYSGSGQAVAATNLPYQPPLGPHMLQSVVHPQQQIQVSPLAVQHGNQQVVAASVVHPQQSLMTTHHSHHAQHPQSQMPGQMISFPAQFMNPSIQFAVANHPQNLHHPQHTHHHQHHQPSPYLIPAVPNSVSTGSMPNANQLNSNSGNVVNYQQTNPSQPPPNANRRTNNKAGQYHNSNQSNANQRPNQPQQQREYTQNVVTASGVPVIAGVGAYSQPNVSGVPPTAAGSAPPHSVYSPIYHTQFSQHPHSRLMSPPSIGMIPGMTYTAAADPATLQQLYMTNMTAVPQFVTVSQQPPSNSTTPTGHPVLIPSPVLHGTNAVASTNIPSGQSATASQQSQSGQHQRSGSNTNISNNGQAQPPTQQPMMITNVPANSQSLNGAPNQSRWM